ncbi:Piso0_004055 [Millerozyma farinosa CBS 7064]|uniref:Piso0_004055 protein n=1 Tax=Pichia sorbitophila (strain ATCC MYA-4447 / BCRC 22081 / CBS 7064 / NBRC 10061 / NRRL Y-12695) TaxID=559304 RepID=G8YA96_PICSO|nr:Piso0_004055 [Millerozyma farinosa CBS 7064]CCE84510.1 Piso0_004055 [Millerozyma farinosa CBS 7064]
MIECDSHQALRGSEGNVYKAFERSGCLLNGKYQYISDIQEGSFGKVTLARDIVSNKEVALKAMYKSNKNTRRMARHEVKILTKLGRSNENICQLLDTFETPDFVVLVLEYCSNGDLYDYIHSTSSRSAVDVWNIAKELSSAIRHAHSLGIYHRDIKPENVLFNSYGRVKLCDWGLSTTKRMSSEFNVGTEKYMAPECLMNIPTLKEYDCKYADYWSFGITLIATVFGSAPFKPVGETSTIESDSNFKNFVNYGNTSILYDIYSTMNQNCYNIFLHLLRAGRAEDDPEEIRRKVEQRSIDNFLVDLQDNWRFGLTIDEEYELEQLNLDDNDEEDSFDNELFSMDNEDVTRETSYNVFLPELDSQVKSNEHVTQNTLSDSHLVPSLIESSFKSAASTSWCDLDDDSFVNGINNLTLVTGDTKADAKFPTGKAKFTDNVSIADGGYLREGNQGFA